MNTDLDLPIATIEIENIRTASNYPSVPSEMNVSTLAGTGTNSSVNGPVTTASVSQPRGIAINSVGEIFISQAHCVRKICEGQVTTFAGNAGQNGVQDGQSVHARFSNWVSDLAVDSEDNIFAADQNNHRIVKD